MLFKISHSSLSGEIFLPSSKSFAARLIFSSIFSQKDTSISGFNISDDIYTYYNAIKKIKPKSNIEFFPNGKFSIKIDKDIDTRFYEKSENYQNLQKLYSNFINIDKKDNIPLFDCKDSAFAFRSLSIILSFFEIPFLLTGSKQLLSRPHSIIFKTLNQGKVDYFKGKDGIIVKGKIKAGIFNLTSIISTQHISGLLMTLPYLEDDSQVYVKGNHDISYIDLTLNILKKGNVNIDKKIIDKDFSKYIIYKNSTFNLQQDNIEIEADWSSASFFLVAAALGGSIKFLNLSLNTFQPDSKIIQVLKLVGADINTTQDILEVKRKNLKAFEFNIENCPDLFPPICVLAMFCSGVTKIYGIKKLKYKESNRIKSIYENFRKLGIKIKIFKDFIEIYGNEGNLFKNNLFKGNLFKKGKSKQVDEKVVLSSFKDHRIFMSLVILGSYFYKDIIIDDNLSFKKSYSNFLTDFKNLNGMYKILKGN